MLYRFSIGEKEILELDLIHCQAVFLHAFMEGRHFQASSLVQNSLNKLSRQNAHDQRQGAGHRSCINRALHQPQSGGERECVGADSRSKSKPE